MARHTLFLFHKLHVRLRLALDLTKLQATKLRLQRQESVAELRSLMTQEQARLILTTLVKTAGNRSSEYAVETPTLKQQQFLDCGIFEALYGGAAGGGKSSALLCGAIRMAARGGAALVIRRTFADLSLPGAIMDRSHEWLQNTSAKWSAQEKRWDFPNGGALQFGYLENDRDKYRYQGAEFTGLYVDELTQFSETQFLYLISRVRRKKDSAIPLEVRCASNPGGIGHDWVKARYVTNAEGRVFIPATIDDNPHIDQTSYRDALMLLDATTRDQLLYGSWVRDDGGQLYSFTEAKNVVSEPPKRAPYVRYILGIDLGASKNTPTTAFSVIAYSEHDPLLLYCIESKAFADMTPSSCAEEIRLWDNKYDFDSMVCDAGALGGGYVEEFRRRYGLPVKPAEKKDKLAMRKLINGELERGTLVFVKDGNADMIKELKNLQWDAKGLDAQPGQPDHLSDSLIYSYREAKHYTANVPEMAPTDPTEFAKWTSRKMMRDVIKKSQQFASRHKVDIHG